MPFLFVDIDQASDLALKLGISAVPTFQLYANKSLHKTLPGATIEQVRAELDAIAQSRIEPTQGAPAKASLIAFSEELFLGSQPNADQLRNLYRIGIRSVLNMRCTDERGFVHAEERWVRGQGLQYALLPVRYANDIDRRYTESVLAKLHDLPKPVLLHCAVGLTSAMLGCLDMAKKLNSSPPDVLLWGMDLGFNFANQAQFYQFLQTYLQASSEPATAATQ